ncbi:putative phospholipid-transporting ATPase IIB [Gracilariopsis chorda]|uniref:Putative phospholipid-transporting ATPase IIB n=1 Tax=Gracilariopsis chorda TaxID=448386 RepID=A0A2V3IL04_9FLOR|nr:putative phospholipid-transporting ATPase IIB [Gracilariopsis chorda]|eukprot:PXF42764.1 putative phospholipid-transporting ATPase IIB [Gracilariopsis chorda]
MGAVQSDVEHDMNLLALTGVEDKLQQNVWETFEKLRHAEIRVWMLTGDKVETATCIAISSRLAERSQRIFRVPGLKSRNEASRALLRFRRQAGLDALVVDGSSLQILLNTFLEEFIVFAATAPAPVACRYSPMQKDTVVKLLPKQLDRKVAAIGYCDNDVGIIQQAYAGIGIPEKERMQASLANRAQYSIILPPYSTSIMAWA